MALEECDEKVMKTGAQWGRSRFSPSPPPPSGPGRSAAGRRAPGPRRAPTPPWPPRGSGPRAPDSARGTGRWPRARSAVRGRAFRRPDRTGPGPRRGGAADGRGHRALGAAGAARGGGHGRGGEPSRHPRAGLIHQRPGIGPVAQEQPAVSGANRSRGRIQPAAASSGVQITSSCRTSGVPVRALSQCT